MSPEFRTCQGSSCSVTSIIWSSKSYLNTTSVCFPDTLRNIPIRGSGDPRFTFVVYGLELFVSVFFVSLVRTLVISSWFGCFSSLILVVRLHESFCIYFFHWFFLSDTGWVSISSFFIGSCTHHGLSVTFSFPWPSPFFIRMKINHTIVRVLLLISKIVFLFTHITTTTVPRKSRWTPHIPGVSNFVSFSNKGLFFFFKQPQHHELRTLDGGVLSRMVHRRGLSRVTLELPGWFRDGSHSVLLGVQVEKIPMSSRPQRTSTEVYRSHRHRRLPSPWDWTSIYRSCQSSIARPPPSRRRNTTFGSVSVLLFVLLPLKNQCGPI